MLSANTTRILSVGIGILMLFHGVDKIINGVDFIAELIKGYGIPYGEYLAYGVYIGEIAAPIMLIIGRYVGIAGALIAINMLIAIILVHSNVIFTLVENGAWSIELPMLYLIAGLALAYEVKTAK